MPRASSSISSESPSQPGNVRCALPGSLLATSPLCSASGTISCTRRTRSSRRPATRAAWSAWFFTASSTAAAKPAIAGVSMVPERMSRSWPPPCTSGVTSTSRRTTSAPTPYGPPTLCPVRVSASTPERGEVDGDRAHGLHRVGVHRDAVRAGELRPRRRPAGGCRPRCWPTSPRSGRPTPGRAPPTRAARSGRGGPSGRPAAARRVAPSCSPSQNSGSRTAWCSTALARIRTPPLVGVAPRPVEALERQVVGLGAAGGEDDLARTAVQRLGDLLPGLLHDPAGMPPGCVQRRGVAGRRELRGHRLDGRREHRRRGGMVEVHGHDLPSVRRGRCGTQPRTTSAREAVQPGVLAHPAGVRRRAARPRWSASSRGQRAVQVALVLGAVRCRALNSSVISGLR